LHCKRDHGISRQRCCRFAGGLLPGSLGQAGLGFGCGSLRGSPYP